MTEPKNVQYLEGLPFLRNRYNCNTKIFATLSTSLPNIDRSFPVNTKYLIFEKSMVSLMSNYFHSLVNLLEILLFRFNFCMQVSLISKVSSVKCSSGPSPGSVSFFIIYQVPTLRHSAFFLLQVSIHPYLMGSMFALKVICH
jgi:hypothetical protein